MSWDWTINEQRVINVLTIIAYKHLCLEMKELERVSVKNFANYVCNNLFEDSSTYREVVRASEGNPRDFLSILSSCCTIAKFDPKTKISLHTVKGAATAHFLGNKAPEIKSNPNTNALFNDIFQRVISNKQKLFLISTTKAETDPRIQELWHHRFIHIINPSYIVLDQNYLAHEYAVYSMDYGKLLNLKVDERGEKFIQLIEAASKLASSLANDQLLSKIIDKGIGRVLSMPIVREPIKKTMGAAMVKNEGIEIANLNNVDYLINHCVVDDLLVTNEMRR